MVYRVVELTNGRFTVLSAVYIAGTFTTREVAERVCKMMNEEQCD
jgi:hypothetical protein